MPSFNSIGGEWVAAKEKVVVTPKVGEPYIYDGKDREAVALIATEKGVSEKEVIEQNLSIGMKVADDPQIMQLARDRGMTLEQYLEANKPTAQQVKVQAEAQGKPVTHAPEPAKSRTEPQGSLGGFYDPDAKQSPVGEFDKKAGKV